MSRNYSYKYKCCVPGCKSRKEKSGTTTFKLHEFPSRSPARELWIVAVRNQFPDEERQKTWQPRDHTKICSLHFSPDQYRQTEKTILLKSGSIPHIFTDQNSSKNENLENESDLLPIDFSKIINEKWVKKPKLKCNDKVPTAVNRNIKAHSSPKIVTLPAVSSCLQNANNHISSYVSDLVVDSSSCSLGVFENSGSTLNSGIAENENIHTHFDTNLLDQILSKDQPVSTGLSGKQNVCGVSGSWIVKELITQSCGTQTMNMITQSCDTQTQTMNMITRSTQTMNGGLKRKHKNDDGDHLKKHRHTVNKLKARILNLEQQNKNLKKLNQGMNESLNLFNINELEKGITNLNARALFLFEQLNSFAKKKTAWSSSTVEIIDTLEKKFPQSYEYLNQTDIISLPPPKNKTQFQVFEKKS